MPKAIDEIKKQEDTNRLLRLSYFQEYLIDKYTAKLDNNADKNDFVRDVNYLIHLIYREAQEHLIKQLTDYVLTVNRPLIFTKEKE